MALAFVPLERRAVWAWVLAVMLAGTLSFAGIGSHSLWTPDEPRDAAIGKAMLASGDWVVPRLNGRPFLEKPPLTWWMQAAGYRLFGASDATSRLPSAVCGALTLLLVFGVAQRLAGARAGLLALGVLATTVQFAADMHRAIVDGPLVLFVALAHAAFFGWARARTKRDRTTGAATFVLAVALAFLAKGWVGLVLGVGPPALVHLFAGPRPLAPRPTVLLIGLSIVVVTAAATPWVLALAHAAGWGAVRETLVTNLLDRTLRTDVGRRLGHEEPVWYYARAAPAAMVPWALAVPALWYARPWRTSDRQWAGFFALTALAGILILSIPSSKRALYLVPLLPAFALCVAAWLTVDPTPAGRLERWTRGALVLLAAALPLALWAATEYGALVAPRVAIWLLWRTQWSATALTGFGLVAAVWAAALVAWLVTSAQRSKPVAAELLVGAFLALFLSGQTALAAKVDPLKNLHELTAAIARVVPGRDVPAYDPSEAFDGIVGFDLGRSVRTLSTPAELEAFFVAAPGGAVVIAFDHWPGLPDALRARLHVVYDERGRRASPYVIVVLTRP
jgi:4-amino-4-deoxy-L-arabinose transferase-like glycosyltransferase